MEEPVHSSPGDEPESWKKMKRQSTPAQMALPPACGSSTLVCPQSWDQIKRRSPRILNDAVHKRVDLSSPSLKQTATEMEARVIADMAMAEIEAYKEDKMSMPALHLDGGEGEMFEAEDFFDIPALRHDLE